MVYILKDEGKLTETSSVRFRTVGLQEWTVYRANGGRQGDIRA